MEDGLAPARGGGQARVSFAFAFSGKLIWKLRNYPTWPRLLGRKVYGWEMRKRAAEGVEEADPPSSDMETVTGAVMRENRDMGIKWPHCHTLFFEGQVAVDMRVACPQDVKKMLLKQARMVLLEEMGSKARV